MAAPGSVNTILGPVAAAALGRTLMHEHTALHFAGAEYDYAAETPAEQLPRVVEACVRAKEAGIDTIVDAAPPDLGRDVDVDREAAARSGLNIVCSTGLYSIYALPHYANPYFPQDADALAANFVRELEVGIGDSGVKAGVIKVATPEGAMGEYAERALRAAARAHVATGAPIITHTENGTLGPEQAALFDGEGADLTRVVIGHNDTGDLGYLLAIADTGATLGFDRMGYERFLPESLRTTMLLALLERGYERQIVLSQDCPAGMPGRETGYLHIPNRVLPALREAGVSEKTIDAMLVANPRRILAGAA